MNRTVRTAMPPVRRVPLAEASNNLIDSCVAVSTDDSAVFSDDYRTRYMQSLRAERAAMRNGQSPAVRDLLVLEDGQPGGWVGWTRYRGPIEAWESTTFLAPRLRGTGMLALARCWQVHLVAALHGWDGDNDSVLLSSIASTNPRSLAASAAYASEQGWSTDWLMVTEPLKGRTSRVLLWPRGPRITHACFQTH